MASTRCRPRTVSYTHLDVYKRQTYNKVSLMLEDPKSSEGKSLRSEYKEVLPHLNQLYALYQVLVAARHERGAIDFETQETRIVFGTDRKIDEIRPTQRNDAHKLICLLYTSRCV